VTILFTGVNFINVLPASFARKDPESATKTENLTVFFALLGSAHIKAAHKMLMKLTRGSYGSVISIYLIKIEALAPK